MRLLTKCGVPAVALVASTLTLAPVAPASAFPMDASLGAGSGNVVQARFHGGRRFHGGGGYRRGYGGYRHRGYGGAAVGAGIAGLAAGAIIGGAIANSQPAYGYPVDVDEGVAPVYADPAGGDQIAYCQSRFRSYDVGSGTYLGFDGLRHSCP